MIFKVKTQPSLKSMLIFEKFTRWYVTMKMGIITFKLFKKNPHNYKMCKSNSGLTLPIKFKNIWKMHSKIIKN